MTTICNFCGKRMDVAEASIEQDARRLKWLEENVAKHSLHMDGTQSFMFPHMPRARTFREAIDRAMIVALQEKQK